MIQPALDHPAVRDYLARLDAATTRLPADERGEIRESIRAHLIDALAGTQNEAEVRNALEALGAPEDIVPAAPTPEPPAVTTSRRALDVVAVVMLLIGALVVPVVGWFVGVVLLWVSDAWTTRQKLLGTFVTPGGLGLAALALTFPVTTSSCTTEPIAVRGPSGQELSDAAQVCSEVAVASWISGLIVAGLVMVPIVVAVYLLRSASRRPQPSSASS